MSRTTTETNLETAGKNYGACARIVQAKCLNPSAPTSCESELLVGFGIASDWVRRSAALKPLEYSKRLMNKSPKSPAVTEMIRFTMAWSALNALFARQEILLLLGMRTAGSELDLFKILLANSSLPAASVGKYESELQALLANQVTSAVPGYPPGTAMTTLQVLHEKFTPIPYRSKGAGRKIQAAINGGDYSKLDLATLTYTMRNWSVHGAIIGSSFRSVPGFNAFMKIILAAVSGLHVGVSNTFLNKL